MCVHVLFMCMYTCDCVCRRVACVYSCICVYVWGYACICTMAYVWISMGCVCTYVCTCAYKSHNTWGGQRTPCGRYSSVPLPCVFLGLNLDHQFWHQEPFQAESCSQWQLCTKPDWYFHRCPWGITLRKWYSLVPGMAPFFYIEFNNLPFEMVLLMFYEWVNHAIQNYTHLGKIVWLIRGNIKFHSFAISSLKLC